MTTVLLWIRGAEERPPLPCDRGLTSGKPAAPSGAFDGPGQCQPQCRRAFPRARPCQLLGITGNALAASHAFDRRPGPLFQSRLEIHPTRVTASAAAIDHDSPMTDQTK